MGGFAPPPNIGGGDKCRETKRLWGGLIHLMRGGKHNFDRLYHKLKVLLLSLILL